MRPHLLLLVLALAHREARADKGVMFGETELRYARATVNQSPYGAVRLDVDLSARPMRCGQDLDAWVNRGTALAVSVHPGPNNSFFAGTNPIAIDVYLYRAGEPNAADVTLSGATLTLAPFKVKAKGAVRGEITIPGHGGGRFATTLCPIKNVKLPVPPPAPTDELTALVDGKPWRPSKVLVLQGLVDKKPTLGAISIVDVDHTCATPMGPGTILLDTEDALRYPGTLQPTSATITPPTGDATYAAITSLAWLQLEVAAGQVRGSFAARQDAAKGARWEASGRFTAELCAPR